LQRPEGKPYDATKRVIDIAVAALGLVVTAPVQLATAGLVLAAHGRPVLFRQPRPGRDGVVFEMVKFRTMLLPDEARQTDAQRLTKVGRLLRTCSLDELPSLWSVLKGDMSLVGPRPLLVQYMERYTPDQARRHEVRPGVTGLAQASGRNGVSWEDRLRLDVQYVDRRSFALDARILVQTLRVVLTGWGVSASGHATMSEFHGPEAVPNGND